MVVRRLGRCGRGTRFTQVERLNACCEGAISNNGLDAGNTVSRARDLVKITGTHSLESVGKGKNGCAHVEQSPRSLLRMQGLGSNKKTEIEISCGASEMKVTSKQSALALK